MPGSHKLTNELECRLGEKGPHSRVLYPAPCETYAKEELNILQLNIHGLQNKKIELVKLLKDQEVHIALLQETILPKKKKNNKKHTAPFQDTLKSHVPAKQNPTAPTVKAS